MSPDLSVVLPCYNEEGNLPELIRRLDEIVDGKSIEIVMVNNGSVDRSAEVFDRELKTVRNPSQFRVVVIEKNEGYGNGILTGLENARGRILGYSHADLQCDPQNILEAYEVYKKTEADPNFKDKKFIVKGKRFDRREEEKLFSYNLDRLAGIIMNGPMEDINGQPKLFSKEFYEYHLKQGPRDLTFDVYLMARALKSNRQALTVPVYFAERTAGVSSWNTTIWSRIKMVTRFLKTILLVRWRSFSWDLRN